jgi:hypothetical protein
MKICVVIPYFGTLPPNINTFLYSASYNEEIDWLIFTDQRTSDLLKVKNVTFIHTTFENIKKRFQKIVNNAINIEAPYKLCDYRPLYGKAFSDYLSNYDYWGYGDLDVVFGNIMKFILPGLKGNYDRIGGLGHFTLYRNDPTVNNRYLLTCKNNHGKIVKPFDRVYKHSRGYAFDELGISYIYRDHHFRTYRNDDLVNETKAGCLDPYSIDPRFSKTDGAFVWSNGRCLYYYLEPKTGRLHCHEYGYFHLLKRHRFNSFLNKKVDSFIITTDGYHQLDDLNDESIKSVIKANHSPYIKRLAYWIHSYFLSGDITFREVLGIHLPLFELYGEIKNHKLRI